MDQTVGNAVIELAEKTEGGIEYIYPLLVKAQVAIGLKGIFIPLLTFILGVGVFYLVWSSGKEAQARKKRPDPAEPIFIGLLISLLFVCLLALTLGCVADGVIRVTNPEYSAIMDVLKNIR